MTNKEKNIIIFKKNNIHNYNNEESNMGYSIPTTKKAKEKFDKLISAADKLFAENGYEKTSIANITSLANVGVGTYYLYFEDKISIYHYILFDYQSRIKRYIASRIGNIKDRSEKERIGLIAWLEFINDNPNTYDIIWQSLAVDRNLFVDYYKKFSESYERRLENDKDQLIDINYEHLALALMGISSFMGLKIMINDGKKLSTDEIETMANSIIGSLKNGLFK